MGWQDMTPFEIALGIGLFLCACGTGLMIVDRSMSGSSFSRVFFLLGAAPLAPVVYALFQQRALPIAGAVVHGVGLGVIGFGMSLRPAPAPLGSDIASPLVEAPAEPETARPFEPAPSEGPRVASARATSAALAFDVIADGDAALLVWAELVDPQNAGAGSDIHGLPLGRLGEVRGEQTTVAHSRSVVRELAAATSRDVTATAWIEGDGAGRAFATLGDASIELGESVAQEAPARGRIAVASAGGGTFVVALRSATGVSVSWLDGSSRPTRTQIALGSPCQRAIVGAVPSADGVVLGLCDSPTGTTDFVRVSLVRGSEPMVERSSVPCAEIALLGTADPRLVDRCGGAHVTIEGARTEVASPNVVTCIGETIALAAGLPTAVPTELAFLLPDGIAPRHARALWTGEAILVATRLGRDVVIQRRQCRAGALTRTDLL